MFTVQRKDWPVKVVTVLLVILCAITLSGTGEPRPLPLQMVNGLISSIVLHSALLLSFFAVKRWACCALAVALIPAALSVVFVMTDYGLVMAVLALGFHIWLIASLFRERRSI